MSALILSRVLAQYTEGTENFNQNETEITNIHRKGNVKSILNYGFM